MAQTGDFPKLSAQKRDGGEYRYEPDMSFIVSLCEAVAPHPQGPQLIILGSSTCPATTCRVMVSVLEKNSLKLDLDHFMCLSPQPGDPTKKDYRDEIILKAVGTTSREEVAVTEGLYQQAAVSTVPVSSARRSGNGIATEDVLSVQHHADQ